VSNSIALLSLLKEYFGKHFEHMCAQRGIFSRISLISLSLQQFNGDCVPTSGSFDSNIRTISPISVAYDLYGPAQQINNFVIERDRKVNFVLQCR
jgi:hypothetical protein